MLRTPFPDPLVLTAVLALLGLAAALCLAAVSAALLLRTRRKGTGALYLLMSALLGSTLIRILSRAGQGVVCYRPLPVTLLLYGGLIALSVSFVLDARRILRTEKGGVAG